MRIELYKSALCPRCAYAAHILKQLQNEFPDIEIIRYDVATDFQVFKSDGIRMIPAIRIQNKTESWIFAKSSQLKDFVLYYK